MSRDTQAGEPLQRGEEQRLVIFGATGRTGKVVVDRALADGHIVTAVARHPRGGHDAARAAARGARRHPGGGIRPARSGRAGRGDLRGRCAVPPVPSHPGLPRGHAAHPERDAAVRRAARRRGDLGRDRRAARPREPARVRVAHQAPDRANAVRGYAPYGIAGDGWRPGMDDRAAGPARGSGGRRLPRRAGLRDPGPDGHGAGGPGGPARAGGHAGPVRPPGRGGGIASGQDAVRRGRGVSPLKRAPLVGTEAPNHTTGPAAERRCTY